MEHLYIVTVIQKNGETWPFTSPHSLEDARSMADFDDVEIGFAIIPIPKRQQELLYFIFNSNGFFHQTIMLSAFMGALIQAGWDMREEIAQRQCDKIGMIP